MMPKVAHMFQTGECPDSAPILNLPYRFFAYADKQRLDDFFSQLHQRLEAAKKSRLPYANGQDVWFFDEVIRIIAPEFQKPCIAESLHFLTQSCNIPEGHLRIENEQVKGLLVETKQIYLSRHAMLLLTRKLMREQMIFREDWSTLLLSSSLDANYIRNKTNFDREIRAAFAGIYFAHPSDSFKELTQNVWDWIQGGLLKSPHDRADNSLKLIFRQFFNSEVTSDNKQSYHIKLYHAFENFKQNQILNTLFTNGNVFWSFKIQYESALLNFGFSKKPNDKGKVQWADADGNVMPMYPGPNYAPHIDFLLSWSIKAFCEFFREEQENCPEENKMEWLEALAKNFFSVLRHACDEAKKKNDFSSAPLFINRHNSDAAKAFKAKKNEAGLDVKQWLFRDTPTKPEESEVFCLNLRKGHEKKLAEFHEHYRQNPSMELAKKIDNLEMAIRDENYSLYGRNLGVFNIVRETLSQSGQFIPRPIICRERPFEWSYMHSEIRQHTDKSIQLDIMFEEQSPRQQWEQKLKELPFIPFQLDGRFSRFNNYFADDPKGNRFCINELKHKTRNPETWLTTKNEPSSTGRTILNCGFEYFLLESDDLEPMEQWKITQSKKDYIWLAIWSAGTKGSIHNIIPVLHQPRNIEEYHWVHKYLIKQLDLTGYDTSTKDNSRCSRVPNVINPQTGGLQKLLLLNPDAVFRENWRPVFEAEKQEIERQRLEEQKQATRFKVSIPYSADDENAKWRNFWIVKIETERKELRPKNHRRKILETLVNTLSCKYLTLDEFHDLLDIGYSLEPRHVKYINELYSAWTR